MKLIKKITLTTILIKFAFLSTHVIAQDGSLKREPMNKAIMDCVSLEVSESNNASFSSGDGSSTSTSDIAECIKNIDTSTLTAQDRRANNSQDAESLSAPNSSFVKDNYCSSAFSISFTSDIGNLYFKNNSSSFDLDSLRDAINKRVESSACIYYIPAGNRVVTDSTISSTVHRKLTNINKANIYCQADFECQGGSGSNIWSKTNETVKYKNPTDGSWVNDRPNEAVVSQSSYCNSGTISFPVRGIDTEKTVYLQKKKYLETETETFHFDGYVRTITIQCTNPLEENIANQWEVIDSGTAKNEDGENVFSCNINNLPFVQESSIVWYDLIWDSNIGKSALISCKENITTSQLQSMQQANPNFLSFSENNYNQGSGITDKQFFKNIEEAAIYNTFNYGELEIECNNGSWVVTKQRCTNAPQSCLAESDDFTRQELRTYKKKNPLTNETYFVAKPFRVSAVGSSCNLSNVSNQVGTKPSNYQPIDLTGIPGLDPDFGDTGEPITNGDYSTGGRQ